MRIHLHASQTTGTVTYTNVTTGHTSRFYRVVIP